MLILDIVSQMLVQYRIFWKCKANKVAHYIIFSLHPSVLLCTFVSKYGSLYLSLLLIDVKVLCDGRLKFSASLQFHLVYMSVAKLS